MSEDTVIVIDEPAPSVDAAPADQTGLPDGARRLDARTVEYTLIDPVSVRVRVDGREQDQKFSVLKLSRFRGRDLMEIEAAAPAERTVVAFARATGLNTVKARALYAEMDQDDISAVAEIILGFNGSGRRTGR